VRSLFSSRKRRFGASGLPQKAEDSGKAGRGEDSRNAHGPIEDRPIEHAGGDLLERKRLSEQIAALASEPGEECRVIGITGPWGSGKTSLLNLVAERLKCRRSDREVLVVRFDPWLFSNAENLTLRFLQEIAAQLRDPRGHGWRRFLQEIAAQLRDPRGHGWRRFLQEIAAQLRASSRVRKVAGAMLMYAKVLEPIAEVPGPWFVSLPASVVRGLRLLWAANRVGLSAEERREKVSGLLESSDRRLVVMIDDLDRLQHREIREVVRMIRLVADFKNTTYLVAYDHDQVAKALSSEGVDGERFIEKIVQCPIEVPPVDRRRLRDVLRNQIERVASSAQLELPQGEQLELFVAKLAPLFRNIRDVRRHAAGLYSAIEVVGSDVAIVDLIALEALRLTVPACFDRLVAVRDVLYPMEATGKRADDHEEELKQALDEIASAAGDRKGAVERLLKCLFPVLQRAGNGPNYDPEWLGRWLREKRVAHPDVFGTYVLKALPKGAILFADIERVVQLSGDRPGLERLLDDPARFGEARLAALVRALPDHVEGVPPDNAAVLIAALYNRLARLERYVRQARAEALETLDLPLQYLVGNIAYRILCSVHNKKRAASLVRGALRGIVALYDRLELVGMIELFSTRDCLVSAEDAEALKAEVCEAVLCSDPQTLAGERDLLETLRRCAQIDSQETRARVDVLVEDDRFLVSLLGSALRSTGRAGEAPGLEGAHYRLDVEALKQVASEAVLRERARQASREGLLTEFDEPQRAAIEAAQWGE